MSLSVHQFIIQLRLTVTVLLFFTLMSCSKSDINSVTGRVPVPLTRNTLSADTGKPWRVAKIYLEYESIDNNSDNEFHKDSSKTIYFGKQQIKFNQDSTCFFTDSLSNIFFMPGELRYYTLYNNNDVKIICFTNNRAFWVSKYMDKYRELKPELQLSFSFIDSAGIKRNYNFSLSE